MFFDRRPDPSAVVVTHHAGGVFDRRVCALHVDRGARTVRVDTTGSRMVLAAERVQAPIRDDQDSDNRAPWSLG
jgi:hypothetical protein